MLETLNEELLNIKLIAADRSMSSQGELAQELTKSLQVLLYLTNSASGSTHLVCDLIELNFIDQKASLKDL